MWLEVVEANIVISFESLYKQCAVWRKWKRRFAFQANQSKWGRFFQSNYDEDEGVSVAAILLAIHQEMPTISAMVPFKGCFSGIFLRSRQFLDHFHPFLHTNPLRFILLSISYLFHFAYSFSWKTRIWSHLCQNYAESPVTMEKVGISAANILQSGRCRSSGYFSLFIFRFIGIFFSNIGNGKP